MTYGMSRLRIQFCFACTFYMYTCLKGTKNVAKELEKITKGPVKTRGVTWFPELADKSEIICLLLQHYNMYMCVSEHSIKIHLYWCMKNCKMSLEKLRGMIINISKHYQVQNEHSSCHSPSPCKNRGYTSSKTILTNERAIEQLTNTFKKTYIYCNSESFSSVHCYHLLKSIRYSFSYF